MMNRTPRDFNAREQLERQWLIENTWCDQCNAADLGIEEPSEYEENGRNFIEGVCRVCGKRIRSEIEETNKLERGQTEQRLIDEIIDQLDDDIHHFAWMVQISRLQNPDRSDSDNIRAVIDSVMELHSQAKIVVGNARDANGIVLIDPWPEIGQELRLRIASALAESDGKERDFCFWIQRVEQFAR